MQDRHRGTAWGQAWRDSVGTGTEGQHGAKCPSRMFWRSRREPQEAPVTLRLTGSRMFTCQLYSHCRFRPMASLFLILPLPTGALLYRQAGGPIIVKKLAWGLGS